MSVTEEVFEDEYSKLVKWSQMENWIVLNENRDDLFFDKKLDIIDNYDGQRAELIKVLLVMDEIPNEISYQMNGTVGMGYRGEVKSMCNEAIQMAKAAKQNGQAVPPTELRFQNSSYNVYFTVRSTGKDDGGGNYYKGVMEVLSKAGKVLGSKEVTGYCGC